ncbi:MAG: hypothetical protein RL604_192 [Pseudomonadota bacterium]|jgi:hypothetical protein
MMANFMKINYFKALCALMCAGITYSAQAQQSSQSTQSIIKTSDAWSYSVSPYIWLPGISSGIDLPGPSVSSGSISGSDVLKHVSGAAMISGEVRKGKWGVTGDLVYAELSDKRADVFDGLDLINERTSAAVRLRAITVAATYRIYETNRTQLETLAGLRHLNADVSFTVGLNNPRSHDGNVHAWDPVVGVKGRHAIFDGSWYIPFYLDVGGQSGRTDTTYQAMLGLGKTFSWGETYLGYKTLYYDMKPGALLQKTKLNGFSLGMGFHF